ncbi:hypothetical protein FHT39_002428 [Mitsuaria sp. BK045]|uniref:type III effector protein chaperone n=1 Tax=unclassified Roseateles TaxID=2626991 RepID=UPI00161B5880|nr:MULTISPECIES: type III effector protein chaperone [unclassified Roseateles]MBB3293789.1 hypothetical protein [Mitsuaria sp. BK041]MBB3363006.1 hypothetical protein [Mitsuaria sp. BK045]
MTTPLDTSAPTSDLSAALPAHVGPLLAHVHGLTRAAARALGMDADAAEQAARDGGLVLDGEAVLLSPVALASAQESKLVVSVTLGLRLGEMPPAALIALLAQAPGLLAVHGMTIGSDPDGMLALHRVVDAETASSESLVQDMLTARQLALLLQDAATPKEQ